MEDTQALSANDVMRLNDIYTMKMQSLSNVFNALVLRWPGDTGVSYLIDNDAPVISLAQLSRIAYNTYDADLYEQYPVIKVFHRDGNTLRPGPYPPIPYLKVERIEEDNSRSFYYVKLKDMDSYDHITLANFMDYALTRPPAPKIMEPGGVIVKTLKYYSSTST